MRNGPVRARTFPMRTLFATMSLLALSATCSLAAGKSSHSTHATESQASANTLQAPDEMVWVGKSDNAQSCSTTPGISLDLMNKELQGAGVRVAEKKKLQDSKMRIAMCGVDKGVLNVFLIKKSDMPKALTLGFLEVKPDR